MLVPLVMKGLYNMNIKQTICHCELCNLYDCFNFVISIDDSVIYARYVDSSDKVNVHEAKKELETLVSKYTSENLCLDTSVGSWEYDIKDHINAYYQPKF